MRGSGRSHFVEQDVGRLDVPVDDARRLHVEQSAEDLVEDHADMLDLEELVAGDHLVQVGVHEVHYDISTAEGARRPGHGSIPFERRRGNNIPQTHNVGTVEVAKNIHFAQHSLRVLGIHKQEAYPLDRHL